jgi:small subunit ribosomal protein S7
MRRAGATHREILPDPKYGSRLVAKFVNMMMYGGKKSTAEHIMYSALGSMEDRAKQDALSMRWLIGSARRRSEKSMAEKLAGELLDAANNRGSAVKKREDTHKMAEANKAFAHYRW